MSILALSAFGFDKQEEVLDGPAGLLAPEIAKGVAVHILP